MCTFLPLELNRYTQILFVLNLFNNSLLLLSLDLLLSSDYINLLSLLDKIFLLTKIIVGIFLFVSFLYYTLYYI